MSEAPQQLKIGATTMSWFTFAGLEQTLSEIAESGIEAIELVTSPPHLQTAGLGLVERMQLKNLLDQHGLRPVSINPTYLDINIVSPSNEFRSLSIDRVIEEIQLAADLGAELILLGPGRKHPIAPMEDEVYDLLLEDSVGQLLTVAENEGVQLGIETMPNGLMTTATEIKNFVDRIDHPLFGIVYDCANTFHNEDPAEGIRIVADKLILAHVSDSTRERWLHTSPGRGQIDFASYADALREVSFPGVTIYELADGENPWPRLSKDLATFAQYGWAV